MSRGICSFQDCGRPVHAYGLCKNHDQQKRRGGSVRALGPASGSIPREQAFWANVNRGAGCWEWTAYRAKDGYGRFQSGGRGAAKVLTHRYAWEILRGAIPEGMKLDHRCHNRGCCNPSHLRVVTNKQNIEHRKGPNADSTTGVLGVTLHKASGRYRVQVTHHGQFFHGGYFADLDEAAEAARQLRLSLFTHNDADRKSA